MDLSEKLLLAFVEEDNTYRAFFRVKPLMTQEGAVGAEDLEEFKDEGFLRVVPDKKEQYTFKDRMRQMSGLCLINMLGMPQDSGKVRLNKNYQPARGENNRYIVYSDAVQELPEHLVYEVITAEDMAHSPLTPCYYLRNGGRIQGPFVSGSQDPCEAHMCVIPPDSDRLFSLTLPGGDRLVYWPEDDSALEALRVVNQNVYVPGRDRSDKADKAAEDVTPSEAPELPETAEAVDAPVAADDAAQDAEPVADEEQEAPLSAQEIIRQLDEELTLTNPLKPDSVRAADAEEDLPPVDHKDKPLTGTPFFREPLPVQRSPRTANPLSRAVDKRLKLARPDALGAEIEKGADITTIQNPVDAFKQALESLWQNPDTAAQAMDAFLSQPGASGMAGKLLCGKQGDAAHLALTQQLQQLEAERLSLLMQVDALKKEGQQARDLAYDALTSERKEQLKKLSGEADGLTRDIASMKAQENQLIEKRDQLLAQLKAAPAGSQMLSAPAGQPISLKNAAHHVYKALSLSGFDLTEDEAIGGLILVGLSETLQLSSASLADSLLAMRLVAHGLGANLLENDFGMVDSLSGGSGLMFVKGTLPTADQRIKRLVPTDKLQLDDEDQDAYLSGPWPNWALNAGVDSLPQTLPAFPSISRDSLKEGLDAHLTGDLPEAATEWMKNLCQWFNERKAPLPLVTRKAMTDTLLAGAALLSGGIAGAMDLVAMAYVLPVLKNQNLKADQRLRRLMQGLQKAENAL